MAKKEAEELTKTFSQSEIGAFISSLNPSKAPGTTGITTGVCQYLFKMIPNVIADAINNICVTITIPANQREGAIVLFPKANKDQRIISNLRPITLLNTLNKHVSAYVTARMEPILDRIIRPWQKAYINDRYIGKVTRTSSTMPMSTGNLAYSYSLTSVRLSTPSVST